MASRRRMTVELAFSSKTLLGVTNGLAARLISIADRKQTQAVRRFGDSGNSALLSVQSCGIGALIEERFSTI